MLRCTRFAFVLVASTLVLSGCFGDAERVTMAPQNELIRAAERMQDDAHRQREAEELAKRQQAADHVHAATAANHLNPQQNRHVTVVGSELNLAQANLPPPSAAGRQAAEDRLAKALSDSESDRRQADELYRQALTVADERDKRIKALEDKNTVAQQQITALIGERDQWRAEQARAALERATAAERDKAAAAATAAEQASRIEALVWMFGIAGTSCVLLAGFSLLIWPTLAIPLGAAGSLCTMLAIFAASAPEWMLWSGSATVLALIGITAWLKYARTQAVADNAIGAIQQLKDRPDEAARTAWGELRKDLVDWFGGKNHPLEAEIDRRLKQMNMK